MVNAAATVSGLGGPAAMLAFGLPSSLAAAVDEAVSAVQDRHSRRRRARAIRERARRRQYVLRSAGDADGLRADEVEAEARAEAAQKAQARVVDGIVSSARIEAFHAYVVGQLTVLAARARGAARKHPILASRFADSRGVPGASARDAAARTYVLSFLHAVLVPTNEAVAHWAKRLFVSVGTIAQAARAAHSDEDESEQ
jgi:hypothetical protein